MCRFTRIFWKVFLDNILPKNGVLVKEFVLQYFAMFVFLTRPIAIRCATNIMMSLAFKLIHLLSHECAFNGLPADSHWFVHNCFFFFNFHLFDALFHNMEHANGPVVMSQNFCAQMPVS